MLNQSKSPMTDEDRYCLTCWYNLRGLVENRCPECGRPFVPGDSSTFAYGKPMGLVAQFFGKVIGWPTNGAALVLLATGLVSSLYPGGLLLFVALCFFGWLLIGTVFFIRVVGFGLVRARWRIRISREDNHWKWTVVPLCFLLTIGLAFTDFPARAFFHLNKPYLDRFVRQAASLPSDSKLPDQWIGCYPANNIKTFAGGIEFHVKGSGFLDIYGYAYSAQGTPPGDHYDFCQPIGDGWHLWIILF